MLETVHSSRRYTLYTICLRLPGETPETIACRRPGCNLQVDDMVSLAVLLRHRIACQPQSLTTGCDQFARPGTGLSTNGESGDVATWVAVSVDGPEPTQAIALPHRTPLHLRISALADHGIDPVISPEASAI